MSNTDKRACERHDYCAGIEISYFNGKPAHGAEILNLGLGGMCFKSNVALQPGATICVRLTNNDKNDAGTDYCEGMRLIALADVKWCREIPGTKPLSYGVGVKYYGPAY